MKTNIVLGIDFGTTSSVVSYYNISKREFSVIPNTEGSFVSPSIMFFDPDSNDILFGNAALNVLNSSLKHSNSKYLGNVFSNLKRLLGKRDLGDMESFFKRNNPISSDSDISFKFVFNQKVTVLTVSEMIVVYLNFLKSYACDYLGQSSDEVLDTVITIPAHYSDTQREIIKECCLKCNLNVLRIINEPTSAAIAYAYANHIEKSIDDVKKELVLVFDCGGGTTDISLVLMDYSEQIYEVKTVVGNNFLGGEDITKSLVEYTLNKLQLRNDKHTKTLNFFSNKHINTIRKACEDAKKKLSYNETVDILLEFGDYDIKIPITRSQFIAICKTFFDKIKTLIHSMLTDALQTQIIRNNNQIASIVFVGGTTRIPYLKDVFQHILGDDVKICCSMDPDQTISIGAAVQGALLRDFLQESSFNDALLLDIVPLSLGVETVGGIFSPIISRNTIIPISRTKNFTNSDVDDSIDINIYQGERKFVCDNYFLASFTLSDLPVDAKSSLVISVTFDVSSDGIITANALLKDSDIFIERSLSIKKNVLTQSRNDSLESILMDAEVNKLYDSEMANKIIAKLELYESFKYLLSVFHEKRDYILQNLEETHNFTFSKLNELFNKTFQVIKEYQTFSSQQLKDTRENFEKMWHELLFTFDPIFKNSDGTILDIGSSSID